MAKYENANFIPGQENYENLTPFKAWIVKNFNFITNYPYLDESYDALTNYEFLCQVVKTLKTTVDNQEKTQNNVIALLEAFTKLEDYINAWFNDLDVQEEINNKLDDLVEDGTLTKLIGVYIDRDINPKINFQDTKISEINTKVNSIASGSPLVATSVSGMTDKNRVYVNTSDGKWYYYDGTQWVAGGTYQSSGIDANDGEILNINNRLNLTVNTKTYTINESRSLDFKLYTGETAIINVTSITDNTSVNIYTAGYTSSADIYITITKKGTYTVNAKHDGYLRIYFINPGTISFTTYLKSQLRDNVQSNTNKINELSYNYIPNQTFSNIVLKNPILHDNYTPNNYGYRFDQNSTIENYTDYITPSSVAQTSPMIRLKDNFGNNLYNIDLMGYNKELTAALVTIFDKNGKYIKVLTGADYDKLINDLNTLAYYAIFAEYPTVTQYTNTYWYVKDVTINWLISKKVNNPIYEVGAGKKYTTLTSLLKEIQNDDSEKIIYIYPGTYNIFNELGGTDYLKTLEGKSLNWRDVNYVIPPNTTVIGKGHVEITWIATADQMINNDIAFLFSPINLSGTCTLKNLTIIAQNCRYALHDETSGLKQFDGVTHKIENCNIIYNNSTYGVKIAYGAGHNQLSTYIYKNCYFYCYAGDIYSMHDATEDGVNYNSQFIFDSCLFNKYGNNTGRIRFLSNTTTDIKDNVLFKNCHFNNNLTFTTGGNTDVAQGYEVKTINCNDFKKIEYNEHVTKRYTTEQYNIIK